MDTDLLDDPTPALQPQLVPAPPPLVLGAAAGAPAAELDPATRLQALIDELAAPLAALRRHRVWQLAARPEALRALMQHHVYCVWDFMSLVKALQARLTCVDVPWVPQGSPRLRRFVNEIVLDEESDEIDGACVSHFELYVSAMTAMRADTGPALRFVEDVASGVAPRSALARAGAPDASRRFVAQTLDVVERGRAWEIAATFTFGREEAIPAMFAELVRSLPGVGAGRDGAIYDSRLLQAYLERHIDVDGGKHAPLARRLVAELCGDDPVRWHEARRAALAALAARHALWDAVAARIAPAS